MKYALRSTQSLARSRTATNLLLYVVVGARRAFALTLILKNTIFISDIHSISIIVQ